MGIQLEVDGTCDECGPVTGPVYFYVQEEDGYTFKCLGCWSGHDIAYHEYYKIEELLENDYQKMVVEIKKHAKEIEKMVFKKVT